MTVKIYYFSGTGNSWAVARDIAEGIGGEMIPMASIIENQDIKIEADIIGIVFPVYYGDLPNIVRRFLYRLSNESKFYSFAVATYGGGEGQSLRHLKQILCQRGIGLSAFYGIQMPQNAFQKPFENQPKIFKSWQRKLPILVNNARAGKTGIYLFQNPIYSALTKLVYRIFDGETRRYLARLSDSSAELSIEELIARADKGFRVNVDCNGCQTCARVCSVGNIKMVNHRPVWQSRCENCLACYNWCPRHAIEGGIASNGYRYLHPSAQLKDFIS